MIDHADIVDAVYGRTIDVHISRAMERRLQANIARFNKDVPEDPMDPSCDGDLAIALAGCADRGLRDGESDAGVWSTVAGHECPLPRTVRAPWTMRARFALRAAVTAWRAA
jgi:hypothetical protein